MTRLPVHVVAGVIRDGSGKVLLARRPAGKQHANLWEFPGGKVEPGEEATAALSRELYEELGLRVQATRSLIRVPCDGIVLDVHEVLAWTGMARSREGQALAWLDAHAIDPAVLPPADRPVVTALRLPDRYLITPCAMPGDEQRFLASLDRALQSGVRMIQLRLPGWSRTSVVELARPLRARCAAVQAILLLNADWALAELLGLDGVHLPARVAAGLTRRPLPIDRWVGVSCHDASELALAVAIGADFATLSPLRPTPDHPAAEALGWHRAAELIDSCPIPVYLLGGLEKADLADARLAGAQGIAAIRGLWQ